MREGWDARADVGRPLPGKCLCASVSGTARRPKAVVATGGVFTKIARHDRLRFAPLEVGPIAVRPEDISTLK